MKGLILSFGIACLVLSAFVVAGFGSTAKKPHCRADCVFGSCSITCNDGEQASCGCAWGSPYCECYGIVPGNLVGPSGSVAQAVLPGFDPVVFEITSDQEVVAYKFVNFVYEEIKPQNIAEGIASSIETFVAAVKQGNFQEARAALDYYAALIRSLPAAEKAKIEAWLLAHQ